MPPRSSLTGSSLTGSFSTTDANNEIVCELKNNDGSNCRKRCLGVCIHPLPHPTAVPSPRSSSAKLLNTCRRSDAAPCRSIFDEPIRNIIFPSFRPPRRASGSCSILHLPKEIRPQNHLLQRSPLAMQVGGPPHVLAEILIEQSTAMKEMNVFTIRLRPPCQGMWRTNIRRQPRPPLHWRNYTIIDRTRSGTRSQ